MTLEQEIIARHKNFRAEIARRAALVTQKEVTTYSIPNTPFGVKKVNPMLPVKKEKPVNREPFWWHCMWFFDLLHVPTARPPGAPSIGFIMAVVARHYGLTKLDLMSARRTQNIVLPRQIAMYFAKTMTTRTLPEIGRRFGGRDHKTVLHAVRKISARCVSDHEFAGLIAKLKAEIGA